jgi:lantibiotic modifying enzyme
MIRRSFFSGAPGIAWVAAACGTAGVGDGLVDRGLGIMLDSTRGEPAESEELDVVSGTAATIVAWLDFHARYDEPALLEAAVMAGDRIIAKAQREPAGVSWTLGSMPTSHNLTGFGHGASGYAWALLELYAATGENRFRDTALDAFRYERACYDAERENWPDYRESDEQPGAEPGFTVAWCHGAAGIGLVRVRAAQLLGDGQLRAEADAALRTVSRSWQEAAGGSNYSLCHGAAGNADLALLAGHVFDDDDARALATAIGDSGIDRYERARMVWPGGVTGGGESPTLMLGSAGTGYFYLRLFDPTLPSVLLLRPH